MFGVGWIEQKNAVAQNKRKQKMGKMITYKD